MDTPLFLLWLSKPKLEAVLLPQERVAEIMQKEQQFQKDIGIRTVITGTVWSDEHYTAFGAEWFPSWKAVRENRRCLDELHWFQYLDTEVFFGVEYPDIPNRLEPLDLDPNVDWLVHIFLARHTPFWYAAGKEEQADLDRFFAQQSQQEQALGMRYALVAYTRPVQEEWEVWGIELFPSMEALVQHTQANEKANWWKYMEARTFLGTAEGGELIKK